MSKLTRKKQKIFGSTGDTSQFGQIGSDAAGTPTTTKDIDTIQSLAQYLSGLYAITGDLNEPPRGQDINALYHLITRQLAYLFEAGIPEWEAATEYSSLTSLVLHGGNVWLSLSNTNIGNTPALGSVHWRKVIDQYGTAQESVSTSSRIFDLTGDRVPPIPDDPAGVTYRGVGFTALPAGWGLDKCTATFSNGEIILTTGAAGGATLFRTLSAVAGKLQVYRVRKISGAVTKVRIYFNEYPASAKEYDLRSSDFYVYAYNAPSNLIGNTGLFFHDSVAGDVFAVSEIYIGTGAYLSKTVDRAGVPWTNVGALPVDGPFGKGLRFTGNAYMQAPGAMIGTTGTVALKFKRGTIGGTQVLCGNYSSSPVTGFNVLLDENLLQARVYSNGTVIFTHTIATISDTNDHDLIVEFTGSNIVSVLDSVKTQTAGTLEIGSGFFTVGRNSVASINYFTGTIYAIRADSRVWTDEEIARWSRDPYSEESVPFSTTPATHSIALRDAAGRMQAASGSASLDVVNKGQLDTKISISSLGSNWTTALAAALGTGWATALSKRRRFYNAIAAEPLGNLFTELSQDIPNINDEVMVSGSIQFTNVCYIASSALRYTSTRIVLRIMNSSNGNPSNTIVDKGSTDTHMWLLSW